MSDQSYRTKRCGECGDDIPYYTRICPFCYYESREGHYDFESSPYLMMLDMKSLTQELIEMKRVRLLRGLMRWFAHRDVDHSRETVLELHSTVAVIYDVVMSRYARQDTIVESADLFLSLVEREVRRRSEAVQRVKIVGRLICITVVIVLMMWLIAATVR